jgi:hypothetical protein
LRHQSRIVTTRYKLDDGFDLFCEIVVGTPMQRSRRPSELASPAALDVVGVVLHKDRIMVETTEAACRQQMGEPIGPSLKLAVSQRLAVWAMINTGRSARVILHDPQGTLRLSTFYARACQRDQQIASSSLLCRMLTVLWLDYAVRTE